MHYRQKQTLIYKSIIGKLNYLERGTYSDIAYASHQYAHFSVNPKLNHCNIVHWLIQYLIGTREHGYYINPNCKRDLEVHIDTDFSGNWDKNDPSPDRDTARSRYGYIISYMGVLVVWKS